MRRIPIPPPSAAPHPTHEAYAAASSCATCTTGWSSRSSIEVPGPSGCDPRRSRCPRPPLAQVAQVDRSRRRREHERSRHQVLGRCTWIVGGVERPLGHRDVSGRLDEAGELIVGDRELVDREAVDDHTMRRCFLRIVVLGSHRKRATSQRDHRRSGPGVRCAVSDRPVAGATEFAPPDVDARGDQNVRLAGQCASSFPDPPASRRPDHSTPASGWYEWPPCQTC